MPRLQLPDVRDGRRHDRLHDLPRASSPIKGGPTMADGTPEDALIRAARRLLDALVKAGA
jgi:hypothetical protein